MKRCGICDQEFTTGDNPVSTVCSKCEREMRNLVSPKNMVGTHGWICTRCGQSNSPYKSKCDCSGFAVTGGITNFAIDVTAICQTCGKHLFPEQGIIRNLCECIPSK